jgi:hypothetical protein
MTVATSIFFQVELPNAPTWFYFSALLAVALFFKYTRLLSVRNWDVLTLFLFMPGLLLLVESKGNTWGYVWLLGATGYFLARCLFDLALVRRPALDPNLSLAGLFWLAGVLLVSLMAIQVKQPTESSDASDANQPPSGDPAIGPVVNLVRNQAPAELPGGPQVWVERGLTLLCHLSIVVGMILIGWRHFENLHAGVAAATFYLLLPYTYLLMPFTALGFGRWYHAWPMALMVWSVFTYRRPVLAGAFLGLAAGTVFSPAWVAPVWLSFYWRRGAGRFATSFLLVAGLCLAVIFLLGLHSELPLDLRAAWSLTPWQLWKELPADAHGIWAGTVHWAYRIPVFVAFLAFVVATLFWPAPKNLGHVLALSAAILLSTQFWYADQGGLFLLWHLPFLLLLVFRPNLTACVPPIPTANGRLSRLLRALWRRFGHFQPATRVT